MFEISLPATLLFQLDCEVANMWHSSKRSTCAAAAATVSCNRSAASATAATGIKPQLFNGHKSSACAAAAAAKAVGRGKEVATLQRHRSFAAAAAAARRRNEAGAATLEARPQQLLLPLGLFLLRLGRHPCLQVIVPPAADPKKAFVGTGATSHTHIHSTVGELMHSTQASSRGSNLRTVLACSRY